MMLKSKAIAALLVVLGATPAYARADKNPAAALAGRVAGPPQQCISDFEGDRGGNVYDSGDILYRGRSSRIYINHPENCPGLRSDRVVVTRTPTRQCRGDIFEIRDRLVPASYGSCTLGSFVPYDKPRAK